MAHQISKRHRCIFVHVPKAAGTSVESTLIFDDQREATGGYVGGHLTALEYRDLYPQQFADYFKFAFVRNPYTRLRSAFEYLSGGGTTPGDREISVAIREFGGDFDAFCRHFLGAEEAGAVVHLRPQVDFVADHQGALLVDFVGRVESMQADFAVVAKRIGVRCRLPHKNRSRRTDGTLSPVLSAAAVTAVYEHYRADFELLGYGQELPPDPAPGDNGRWVDRLRARAKRAFGL